MMQADKRNMPEALEEQLSYQVATPQRSAPSEMRLSVPRIQATSEERQDAVDEVRLRSANGSNLLMQLVPSERAIGEFDWVCPSALVGQRPRCHSLCLAGEVLLVRPHLRLLRHRTGW